MVTLNANEARELALNLDWGNPFDNPDDTKDSLRTNWEEPLDDESVELVYSQLCKIWLERHNWFAILEDKDDTDWGYGSFDYDEAVQIAIAGSYTVIAEIEQGNDPVCVREYIYGVDFEAEDEYILIQARCTRSEAARHLKNGTTVYKDMEKHLDEYIDDICWGLDDDDNLRDDLRRMVESKGEYCPADWKHVTVCGKDYYIMFVL